MVLMLAPIPFANALASATLLLYLVFYALKLVAPPFFKLLLNSQFFGVDIASQVPPISLANFVGVLIAVGVFTWVWAYLAASFYNRFLGKS